MKRVAKLVLMCAWVLAGCAGNPEPRQPPLRVTAENASRQAVSAALGGRWESAVESWHEAVLAYQSIDDWEGQGRARLGLSQAWARLGNVDQAQGSIAGMDGHVLFSSLLRARAAYQQALLALPDNPAVSTQKVKLSRELCGPSCGFAVALDNLDARLALLRADLGEARRFAGRALEFAGGLSAERSHAHRLLAELDLRDGELKQARMHLEAALVDDRHLAEPQWLLDDYRLLKKIARESGDDVLLREATLRLDSLCKATRLPDCVLVGEGGP